MTSSAAPAVDGPTIEDVRAARARLEGVARRTPLQRSAWLSEAAGVPVHLKLECWQRTHSFKFRGAYNAIADLPADIRARGVVTASAGNHGQAVALAARLTGTRATVFVPTTAPRIKKSRIAAQGAELRESGSGYDEAADAAVRHAREQGAHYVHAFSDPAVVAGQGTAGLEIVDALPGVRQVIVPVGGGGLLAGVGVAVGDAGVRVAGVQSTATRAMHAAFEAGAVVPTDIGATLCDGLAGDVEPVSFQRALRVGATMHLVDEARVAPAIRALYEHEGLVAEGAGVVGVAALLAETVPLDGPVAVVITGGNIDAAVLARILAEA